MTLVRRLAVAAVASAALSGCGDKKAEAPKEFAPPPKVGPSGVLRGGEGPALTAQPKPTR
jgi:hypothetical protein